MIEHQKLLQLYFTKSLLHFTLCSNYYFELHKGGSCLRPPLICDNKKYRVLTLRTLVSIRHQVTKLIKLQRHSSIGLLIHIHCSHINDMETSSNLNMFSWIYRQVQHKQTVGHPVIRMAVEYGCVFLTQCRKRKGWPCRIANISIWYRTRDRSRVHCTYEYSICWTVRVDVKLGRKFIARRIVGRLACKVA